jgi:hypothetical protein
MAVKDSAASIGFRRTLTRPQSEQCGNRECPAARQKVSRQGTPGFREYLAALLYQVSTPVSSVATLVHLQLVPPGPQKQISSASPADAFAHGAFKLATPGPDTVSNANNEAGIAIALFIAILLLAGTG